MSNPTPAPTPAPAQTPLPDKATTKVVASFMLPHVLKETASHSGRDVFTVINGGNQQVEITGEHWYSETPVDPPQIFAILSPQNQISIGGKVISVINDPVTFGGKKLLPTNPTATQYFAQVGKQVFLSFKCAPVDPTSEVAKTHKRPALYAVRQTSIILP
jgi:hypothetical protein